jgi:hypothetical protein
MVGIAGMTVLSSSMNNVFNKMAAFLGNTVH